MDEAWDGVVRRSGDLVGHVDERYMDGYMLLPLAGSDRPSLMRALLPAPKTDTGRHGRD